MRSINVWLVWSCIVCTGCSPLHERVQRFKDQTGLNVKYCEVNCIVKHKRNINWITK